MNNEWYQDTDFMTLKEFIERLRIDLNDPNFDMYDMPVPRSESEYQQRLTYISDILTAADD